MNSILARRDARSDPPPRLAGRGVLDSSCWLSSPVSVLLSRSCQVLIRAWLDPCPLLNPPQPGPTFRQAVSFGCGFVLLFALFSHLFFDLVFYRFFLRFGLHFGSQNRPQTGKNLKKWVFKSEFGFASVFLQIFFEIRSFFARANP